MINKDEYTALCEKFPWLRGVYSTAEMISDTLVEKETHYQGSWQQRGGQGAFFMMARKWDRIENIARAEQFNIFEALRKGSGDVEDDIKDLIGYLLLVLQHPMSDPMPEDQQ